MQRTHKMGELTALGLAAELLFGLSAFGAGAEPPDIASLTYVQKTIELTKATYTITVPAGEFWDVSKISPADGVTPSRINVTPAAGAMIRFAPGSFSEVSGKTVQFSSASGWILIDNDPFLANPTYQGGNILVTNDVSVARYLGGAAGTEEDHHSSTIYVREGYTFSLTSGGGIRFAGMWITKAGTGTLALSGSKGSSAFTPDDPEKNSGHLIVEAGVVDFTEMGSNNFFCYDLSKEYSSTLEVYDDAVVKFGDKIPDIRNLIMRGGKVESTQDEDAGKSSLIICNSLTVLPNATPSVIDAPCVGLSQIVNYTNVVHVAEGAALKIEGSLMRSDSAKSTGVLRKKGSGTLEVEGSKEGVTVLLPDDLLNEAAIWIDATDLEGYAAGENVNVIANRGTAGGEFRNFVKSSSICASKGYLANWNGQLPGPEYSPAGINGLPALRFCLTNALYTTAYENIGGSEMTVFCVTAYLPTLELNPEYGLVDMTYNGSPLNSKNECLNRLILQECSAFFGKSDTVAAAQFPDGDRTQPRVLVASRTGRSAAFSMYGTDAQGVSSASKTEMVSNWSNRIDVVVLGGYLSQTLKNGPYCRCDGDTGAIDYETNQRMASGMIGEYIVFDRKLSAEEENFVANYLRRKWLGSEAEVPRVETKSALTLTAAANETNEFAASVYAYSDKEYGAGVDVSVFPSVVKTGAGSVAVTGLMAAPTAFRIEAGEIDFTAGVDALTTVVAEDGTRLSSRSAAAVTLAGLAVGDNVTFVREPVSRDPSAFKMFDVSGTLAIGKAPTAMLSLKPGAEADFLSYGALEAFDPLEWTICLPNGKLCEMKDDRENNVFRLVPQGGLILLFR